MMTNSKQNYENYDQIVTQRVKMCEVVCTVSHSTTWRDDPDSTAPEELPYLLEIQNFRICRDRQFRNSDLVISNNIIIDVISHLDTVKKV